MPAKRISGGMGGMAGFAGGGSLTYARNASKLYTPAGLITRSRWNPLDIDTHLSLTNNNRTVITNTNDGTQYGVRGDTPYSSGKWAFEVITDVLGSGVSAIQIGLANSTTVLNTFSGGSSFLAQNSTVAGGNVWACLWSQNTVTVVSPWSVTGAAGLDGRLPYGIAVTYRMMVDFSSGKAWFGLDNTMLGDPFINFSAHQYSGFNSNGPYYLYARLLETGGVVPQISIPVRSAFPIPIGYLMG